MDEHALFFFFFFFGILIFLVAHHPPFLNLSPHPECHLTYWESCLLLLSWMLSLQNCPKDVTAAAVFLPRAEVGHDDACLASPHGLLHLPLIGSGRGGRPPEGARPSPHSVSDLCRLLFDYNEAQSFLSPPRARRITPEDELDPLQAIISEFQQGQVKTESQAKDAAGVFQEIERPSEEDNREVLSKFVRHIMREGKRTVAERLVRNSLVEIKRILPDKDPVEVFVSGLNNVKPLVEVRALRKSGKNYQVPVPVTTKRQFFLASKWIRTSALKKKGLNFGERLAAEILDAFNGQGKSIEKRKELHKTAQANRAFSHFKF